MRFPQRWPVASMHGVPPLSSATGFVPGCSAEEQAAPQRGSPPLWWSRWPLGSGNGFKTLRRAPKGRGFEEKPPQMATFFSRADQGPWWVLPLGEDLWDGKVTLDGETALCMSQNGNSEHWHHQIPVKVCSQGNVTRHCREAGSQSHWKTVSHETKHSPTV